jgi:hypothetical protein
MPKADCKNLPLNESVKCKVACLELDLENPRLQTGEDFPNRSEDELIETLADIAALDELVLSICTNGYLDLEPLIVHGPNGGPYKVIEGNRRLASIKLIKDQDLSARIGVRVPRPVGRKVLASLEEVLVYRVASPDHARAFIGFKHINGPQRWDAYAKAKYVTDWYKQSEGKLSISSIADMMGDNNNTLRAYIYAVLMLEQAERTGQWSIADRPPARGRFPFSHLYTALQRVEFQKVLGLEGWSDSPSMSPVKAKHLNDLGEVLRYMYGDVNSERESVIRSQNPDLKNLGLALVNDSAREALQNGYDLDQALDLIKEGSAAFKDALLQAKLRLHRAIEAMARYKTSDVAVEELVEEIYDQADTLKTMVDRKRSRPRK